MKTIQKFFLTGLFLSISSSIQGWAQVNISGKSGLMYIPSAEVQEDGTFSAGYSLNPTNYGFRFNKRNAEGIYFLNLAMLRRVEININLLTTYGPIAYSQRGIGDRQIDLKYVVLTEKTKRPSVAVILSTPFGIDNSLITNAVVATKHISLTKSITAAISVGMGSPYSIYRADVRNDQDSDIFSGYTLKDKRDMPSYYLAGPFGGVKLSFGQKAGLMVEWDSQYLNVGTYALLFKHWTVQAGLINGDQLTAGTSYSMNLLHLPKRLVRKHEGG